MSDFTVANSDIYTTNLQGFRTVDPRWKGQIPHLSNIEESVERGGPIQMDVKLNTGMGDAKQDTEHPESKHQWLSLRRLRSSQFVMTQTIALYHQFQMVRLSRSERTEKRQSDVRHTYSV